MKKMKNIPRLYLWIGIEKYRTQIFVNNKLKAINIWLYQSLTWISEFLMWSNSVYVDERFRTNLVQHDLLQPNSMSGSSYLLKWQEETCLKLKDNLFFQRNNNPSYQWVNADCGATNIDGPPETESKQKKLTGWQGSLYTRWVYVNCIDRLWKTR